MNNPKLAVILWLAQSINPQVARDRELTFDLAQLRQCDDGTLGREVANFLDTQGFDPLKSGDWIQRTHDIWHVLTGLSSTEHDEFLLQAFTRAQVFRPTSAILVLIGLLTRRCNIQEVAEKIRQGRQAKPILDWDIEADWNTPLNEVRQKLGITPLTAPHRTVGAAAESKQIVKANDPGPEIAPLAADSPPAGLVINQPAVVAEVTAAFQRYEAALISNDVAVLDELFWDSPHTIRYGATENLYGAGAIAAFRRQRPAVDLTRTLQNTVITTYGTDFATANTEFTKLSSGKQGRQSQTWLRSPAGWRVVSAHVSFLPISPSQ